MAVDFSTTFGSASNQSSNTNSNASQRADRPQAQVWLNIGYVAKGAGKNGEDTFLALPTGVPLDTMEKVSTANIRDENYLGRAVAQNELLDQLMGVAAQLQPGEDRVVGIAGGLSIQIRRVAEKRGEVTAVEGNPYGMKLAL